METGTINWDATKEDYVLARRIAIRAAKLADTRGVDTMGMEMDIIACHMNGCRLRLGELLKADDFNFGHDVFGIERQIDRETGKLRNSFVPRFAEIQ